MKKLTALLLCMTLLLALIAGCSGGGEKITLQNFVGKWENKYELGEDDVPEMLSYFGFTEEEQKFVDEKLFYLVQVFEVQQDGSYRFYIDAGRSLTELRQGFYNALVSLYEKRQYLTDLYGEEVVDADFDEFAAFYVQYYDLEDLDAYLDAVMADVRDYFYNLDEDLDLEHGTLTVEKDDLALKVEGESAAESVGYSLGETSLLLTYADGEELYYRVG